MKNNQMLKFTSTQESVQEKIKKNKNIPLMYNKGINKKVRWYFN